MTEQRLPFEDAVRELLERAGGALSLGEASGLLGVSRQALHKRLLRGEALGLMVGNEIKIPKFQLVENGERMVVCPGVGSVVKLFNKSGAGPLVTLQFFVGHDPNLGVPPMTALRIGKDTDVLHAARSHLRLDEN
jgi:hypothetical protein